MSDSRSGRESRDLLLIQAHRDELGQPAAFADDSERAVPGID
jgi:hypothetical protein